MMTYRVKNSNGTTVLGTVCAVVFCLFSLLYLVDYQSEVLMAMQHDLSKGATHYNTWVGGILITFILFLIRLAMQAVFPLRGGLQAINYLPSTLLLTMLTAYRPDMPTSTYIGLWAWLAPLLLAVYVYTAIVLGRLNLQTGRSMETDAFSSLEAWIASTLFCAQFLFCGLMSESNDVYHYRVRMERMMMQGRYTEALEVGKESAQTDSNLTMLRASALVHEGQLGDRLFRYPVKGSSSSLLPLKNGSHCLFLNTDTIFRNLGAKPLEYMDFRTYVKAMQQSGRDTIPLGDYRLCALLIDRKLDAFVRLLPHYYEVDSLLPHHYREALILYTHLRAHPVIVYHDNVLDTDFNDFQKLDRKYGQESERRLNLMKHYFGTYWWYYYNDRS